ncbi:hypothetical protein BT96DRAFT_937404 [Gymnopus androsaceus JB14]|uniref:Uncharacterized protein n=1 Tax=Gymnopus androsaceus JB14 TaxID=1447944 RepID=A0A6A4HW25_9AGAR|nr:hypothetical protein BT96DRAFT_937404 [Gymnopus androsaceus JB14]
MENLRKELKEDHALYRRVFDIDTSSAFQIQDKLVVDFERLGKKYSGPALPEDTHDLQHLLARKASLTEYQSARVQAQMAFEQVLSRGGDKAEAEAPVGQDAKAEVPVGAPDVQYKAAGKQLPQFSDDEDNEGEPDDKEYQYNELQGGARDHWESIATTVVQEDVAEDEDMCNQCVGNPQEVQAAVWRLGASFHTLAQLHLGNDIAKDAFPMEYNLELRAWAFLSSFNEYTRIHENFADALNELMTDWVLQVEYNHIKTQCRKISKQKLLQKASDVNDQVAASVKSCVDISGLGEKPAEAEQRVQWMQTKLAVVQHYNEQYWAISVKAPLPPIPANLKQYFKPYGTYLEARQECLKNSNQDPHLEEKGVPGMQSPAKKSVVDKSGNKQGNHKPPVENLVGVGSMEPAKTKLKVLKSGKEQLKHPLVSYKSIEDVDEDVDEDEEDDDEEKEEGERGMAQSACLGKEVRDELMAAEAKYKHSVEAIAKKHGFACSLPYLEDDAVPKATRRINVWNAFKVYYSGADHQMEKLENDIPLLAIMTETNEHLQHLYHDTLVERLSEEDLNDPEKQKHAMAPELEWYKGQVDQFIQVAESKGKVKASVKKILKPMLKLCHDLEAMLGSQEIEVRGLDADLAKLWTSLSKVGNNQNADWKRCALGSVFKYDIVETFGDEVGEKITLNNFLDVAWKQEICITNCPVEEFPKYNWSSQKAMSMDATWLVLAPRWQALQRAHNDLIGKWWAEKDRKLTYGEWGDIPLVINHKGKTVVTVKDVASWQEACKNPLVANANQGHPHVIDDVSHRKVAQHSRRLKDLNVTSDSEAPLPRAVDKMDRKRKQDGDSETKGKAKKQRKMLEDWEAECGSESSSPNHSERKGEGDSKDGAVGQRHKKRKRKVQPASSRKSLSPVAEPPKMGPPGKGKIRKTAKKKQKLSG